MATQKRAHHALTLEKKMDVILDFESGSYSKTALATKHGVPKSSLTRILHDKDKLQDAFETSRFGPPKGSVCDTATTKNWRSAWFCGLGEPGARAFLSTGH
ncbi:hypothetical protein ISCGN_001870 [Ixodes scapularis]